MSAPQENVAASLSDPRLKVVIIFSHSLLVSGIEAVLREHKVNAEVILVDIDQRDCAEVIRNLRHSDMVILDSRDSAAQRMLTSTLLTEATVISINSGENVMEIHRKQTKMITELTDLVDVVKGHQA
jgi:hypothetical protein